MGRLLFAAACGTVLLSCAPGPSGERRGPSAASRLAAPPAAPGAGAPARRACRVDEPGSSCLAAVPTFVPGRLVVKFRDRLAEPADVLHGRGRRFADAAPSGGAELDRLNAGYRVRAVRAAFPWTFAAAPARAGRGVAAERRKAFHALVARVRSAFPARSRRAPPGSEIPDLTSVFVLEVDATTDLAEMARAYSANPNVEYAAPDAVAQAVATTNDPFLSTSGSWGQPYEDLWGLTRISARDAWDVSTGAGTVVAVVDSGLDRTHPDIAANEWTNAAELDGTAGVDDDENGLVDDVRGWDFAYGDADPLDLNGHGTHVAGTIAAAGDNGIGVVGVAYRARIMALKALDDHGYGGLTGLADAIAYAARSGADVVNNSWSCPGCTAPATAPVLSALALARSLGCVVTFAAGNDAADVRWAFPANVQDVVTVSSSGADDHRSSFSNFGWLVDLAAPGGGPSAASPVGASSNVLSLRAAGTMAHHPFLFVGAGQDYIRFAGTSMATPHVSGVAALVLAANPDLTVQDVEAILRQTAADGVDEPEVDGPGYDPYLGWGRLDAAAAVSAAVDAISSGPPADPPVLAAVADELAFDLPRGGCAGEWSLPVDLYNVGGGALSWTATGPGWLGFPASGTAYTAARASIATPGDGSGVLSIDAPGAVGGHLELPVAQRIVPGVTIRTCSTVLAAASGNQQWDPPNSQQTSPPGVADGAGGAIYAWTDTRLGNPDVWVQRVDALGIPQWYANGVALTSAPGYEGRPALVADGAGGAIVAYVEGGNTGDVADEHVRVQRIDATGQKRWGESGVWVCQAAGGQVLPKIASDGQGGAIVAWGDFRGGNDEEDVYAQRIDAAGNVRWQVDGVPVSAAPDAQSGVALVEDGQGGAFLTWVDRRTTRAAIYAQRLDADGAARWTADGIMIAPETGAGPNVVSDGGLGAIVVWHDYRNVPAGTTALSRSDLYAQRLDAAGGSLWTVNGVPVTEGLTVSPARYVPGWLPDQVTAAPDGAGGALVAWHDARSATWDLYAQRIGADGERRWGARGAPVAVAAGDQTSPALAPDGRGGAMLAWMDRRPGHADLFLQRLGPDGAPLLPAGGVWVHGKTSDQAHPHLVPLARRRFLLGWDDVNDCGWAFCTPTAIDLLGAVLELNDAPVALAQSLRTPEDVPLALTLTASDAEGDPLAYAIVAPPAHGTLSGSPPALVYAPAPDYAGPDAFAFTASDGTATSAPAMVDIEVVAEPPAPGGCGCTTGSDAASLGLVLLALALGRGRGPGDPPTRTYSRGCATRCHRHG